jgi:nitroreductase
MTGKEGDDNDLVGISEAAIWALSSFNNQIWRFIYLKRNRNEWTKFVGLLNEGNRI